MHNMDEAHRQEIKEAKFLLENPSVAARFSDVMATPIEKGMKLLPANAKELILKASEKALTSALEAALFTLDANVREASNFTHKALSAVSGAVGGAFGLPALAVELPISTTIMLRSIADIARSEGEDLASYDTRLACLEVFALGGTSETDDSAEMGYFAIRSALSKTVSEAVRYAASKEAIDATAPPLVKLVSKIAVRFGIPVTEKAAAQAAPLLGAAGGALLNTLFIDHFQDMARGHFVIRRMERLYGTELVKEVYGLE